jgi:methylmalonyl-CoA epimerase
MKMVGVQHVGIAVKDLDASIENLEGLFDFGNATVELVSPTHAESPISKYLEKRGNGIHHICFDVQGIDDWLDTLKAGNVKLLNDTPRAGASRHRVAFIDPASAGGILFELSE